MILNQSFPRPIPQGSAGPYSCLPYSALPTDAHLPSWSNSLSPVRVSVLSTCHTQTDPRAGGRRGTRSWRILSPRSFQNRTQPLTQRLASVPCTDSSAPVYVVFSLLLQLLAYLALHSSYFKLHMDWAHTPSMPGSEPGPRKGVLPSRRQHSR